MEETRDEDITVYLTEQEKRQIRRSAAKEGLQMSTYVRQKALQQEQVQQA